MNFPKNSDEEVLMREINDAEIAMAEIRAKGACDCLIDPAETLGDRIRHLGAITLTLADWLQQARRAGTSLDEEN